MAFMRYSCEVSFDFDSERAASAVESSLAVDRELNPEACERSSRVEGSRVIVTFRAVDAKQLRVSVGGFFELADVACQAVEAFA